MKSGGSGLDGKSGEGTDTTLGDSAFNLTYEDYLKLFVMLGLTNNRDSMMIRTAQLIQLNYNTAGALGREIKDTLDMNHTYTMVSVESSANVQTLFLNLEITTNEDGSVTYDNIGASEGAALQYKSVIGY